MAEFFGMEAIAKRLGLGSHATVRYWIDHFGLPAFRRRRPGKVTSPRSCQRLYYTNDEMILAWQLARAKQEREEGLARREARARTTASPTTRPRSTGPVVGPETPPLDPPA